MLRNYSWVIPDHLAGMAWPGDGPVLAAAAKTLSADGVGLVVTLTIEPINDAMLRAQQIEWLHLPVSDFAAPTPAQLRSFVSAVDRVHTQGRGTVAHCAAGIGRTGTCLAAYLVHRGAEADDAIAQVRAARPRSIESSDQRAAVRAFAQSR